jgi:hypothetical protein
MDRKFKLANFLENTVVDKDIIKSIKKLGVKSLMVLQIIGINSTGNY